MTKTLTPTRSTSAPLKRRAAASNEASTSASAASAMPSTGLPITSEASLGDMQKWSQTLLEMGAMACITVAGADTATLTVKLPSGKRLQSLPPGDILVVILPPVPGRAPGVNLIEKG